MSLFFRGFSAVFHQFFRILTTKQIKISRFLSEHTNFHQISKFQVMFQASDNGSLLRPPYRHELYEISKEIVEKLQVDVNGVNKTYGDMCEPYCEKNDAFFALMDIFESNSTDSFEVIGRGLDGFLM